MHNAYMYNQICVRFILVIYFFSRQLQASLYNQRNELPLCSTIPLFQDFNLHETTSIKWLSSFTGSGTVTSAGLTDIFPSLFPYFWSRQVGVETDLAPLETLRNRLGMHKRVASSYSVVWAIQEVTFSGVSTSISCAPSLTMRGPFFIALSLILQNLILRS